MRGLLRAIRQSAASVAVDPNLKLELKFNQTAYTDTGGTTLCVYPGTPSAASWRSNVNGINSLFAQATSGNRPTVQSDGMYFDGGDNLDMVVSGNWLTGDFTLECWANSPPMMAISQASAAGVAALVLFGANGLYTSTNGSSWAISGMSIGGASSAWAHYAIVGNSATIRSYKDGVQVTSQSYTSGSLYYNASNNHVIGKYFGGSYMTGKMTDIRLYSTCLYPSGTTFTPPTRTT